MKPFFKDFLNLAFLVTVGTLFVLMDEFLDRIQRT